ncbi:MAG: hypothetical protein A3G38_01640 [Omnitrophica WOR_2 bacterium RIFCSPLOWO2_12_FULL_51_8]|nr:MAG: hypothetical protein A3G38_01640 [Omnitrophica WOR_2 bacterium RIFCSPLOWO2_12_FULL_51_8]
MIYNTLTLNGKITANGVDGQSRSFLGEIFSGGGGSGGSVYIIAQKLAGSGSILSNGGNAAGGGGGAGGGRIAVYYKASTLTGAVEAKGGIGYQKGEDGTIVFQPISLDTPVTTFNLLEKSSTANVSQETLTTQKLNLSNVQITGDLTGTVDFSRLDLTAVTSGPFSGKGFIEAEFQTTLEGASYGGNLQGVVYPDSQGDKLYLKGSISGLLISGTCEGALSESTPGSGTFDKFEAAWKLNRLNTDSISAALALGGTISSQSSYSFTSQIYLYQGDFEGNAYGSYTGPLSAILTHLRLTSDNEYTGKGFSIISYNTAFEQGKGYSHNQLDAGAILEFQGLFENPLSGKLSAFLDENKSPKILSGTIERLDLGLTPAPDLKIDTWAPSRLSSGQTFDYIIELRNDGLKAAENVKLIDKLPFAVSFHDSTAGADYSEDAHQVVFQIPELSAKAIVYKRVAGAVLWGIPINSTFGNIVYIPKDEETPPPLDPTAGIDYEVAGDTQESALVKIKTSNQAEEVETIMSINVRESAEPVQPSFDVVETPLAVTTDFSLGSFSPTVVEGEWDAQNNARQITERAVDTAQRIIATTREGAEIIRSIREERDFLTWLYDNGYIDRTNYENYSQQKTIGYHGLRYFLPRIIDRLISNNLSRLGQRLRRLFRINESQRQIRQGIIRTIDGMKFYSDKELEAVIRASITEVLRRGGKPAETIERAWEIFLEERRLTFNSQISSSLAGHDPNELLVSPEGNVKPGDKLSYTINYENEGEGNAYGVYITDRLLANLDDATLVVNNGGKYDPATRAITWFIGELPSKQKGSVTFSVNVNSYAQDKSEVINFAAVYFPSVPEITRTNGTVNIVSLVIDTVAPVTEILPSPLPNPAGWNSADVTINLTAADNEDGTGVKEIHYALTGVTFEERTVSGASASITIPSEGTTTLNCYAVDNAGNTESPKSFTVKIDKTPPIISAQSAPQANASGWNNSDVIVSFTAEDSLSGVVSVNEPVNVTQEGAGQHIGGQAIDAAGNSASAYVVVNLDKTPPQVNITANPNLLWPPNHKTADVTIGGEAKDSLSGILLSTFKVDDEYKTIEPPISDFNTIVKLEAWRDGNDKDGRYYNVSVTTKDKAGNTASNVTTVICPHDRGKK